MSEYLWRLVEVPLAGAMLSALNVRGEVVGMTESGLGFVWRPGETPEILGDNVCPHSINDVGMIVGERLAEGVSAPFVYHGAELQPLDLLHGHRSGRASDVNNHGEIVGYSCTSQFGLESPGSRQVHQPMFTIWRRAEGFRPESFMPSFYGLGVGINDAREMVGCVGEDGMPWSVVAVSVARTQPRYPSVTMENLVKIDPAAISSLGVIVANVILDTPTGRTQRAVCFSEDEAWGLPLELRSGEHSQGHSINRSGLVVGSFGTSMQAKRAMIGDRTFAGDLLPLVRDARGWTLVEANDVNDRGMIVGWGMKRGRIAGFMLEPL